MYKSKYIICIRYFFYHIQYILYIVKGKSLWCKHGSALLTAEPLELILETALGKIEQYDMNFIFVTLWQCDEYSDIRIYSNIFRHEYSFVSYSYPFFDTNIFGHSFVLFFSIRIYSDIRSYQNFIFVTLWIKSLSGGTLISLKKLLKRGV